jgi:tetrahydromethanopterin S-methyltransferase subunit G
METSTASTSATTTSVGLRYGVLTGLVIIIYSFVLFATEQEMNQALGWVSIAVLPIAGIILAHKAFKQANAGFMSYGQGLGIGVLLSLVSGLLTAVFSYVYRTFIDPDLSGRMLEKMRAKLEAMGSMSDAQIDQTLGMSTKFSTGPIGFAVGILSAVLFGLVFSLVIAAITKNSKPEFE